MQKDIANLKVAAKVAGVPNEHVFIPATAASGVGRNEYYKSEEEYFHAVAAALSNEYSAIVAAGFLVQVDDPFLPDIFFEPGMSNAQKKRRTEIYVDVARARPRPWPCNRLNRLDRALLRNGIQSSRISSPVGDEAN